jgi:hypothetical protein
VELLGRYSKIPAPLPEWPSTGRCTRTAVQPRVHDVRRRLTNEVIARLVHDYESGHSTTALMRTYQLGEGTVLGILAEHGVKMRGQGIPEGQVEAIRLYIGGLSLKRVANRLDSSAETGGRLCLRLECHCEDSGSAAHVSHVT